jgi:hypothetical protein
MHNCLRPAFSRLNLPQGHQAERHDTGLVDHEEGSRPFRQVRAT